MVGVRTVLKWFAFCSLVFLFFVFSSGLDFIVHKVLYGYGLRFSYDWASSYWSFYGCIYLVFSISVGFVYWLGSGKSGKDIKVAFGLFLSIFMLFLGGFADILWFVFWDEGLPSGEVVWWWSPWFRVFGFWNSFLQLFLLGLVFVSLLLFWIWILRS